jgi:hypothetical protein
MQTHQFEIMTDLLRIVMARVSGVSPSESDRVEAKILAVAEEMGVRGIYLGPKLGDEDASLLLTR